MNRRRGILFEVLAIYLVTVGAIKLLYELRFVPVLQEYVWTIAMLLQIYVPAWLLYKRQETMNHYGLHMRNWESGLKVWFILCVVLFIPATIGSHIWQTSLNRKLSTAGSPYHQFSMSMRGIPNRAKSDKIVQIYAHTAAPELSIRWRKPISGWLKSDGPIIVHNGVQWVKGSTRAKTIYFTSNSDSSGEILLRMEGQELSFRLYQEGKKLPLKDVRLGPKQEVATSNKISRGWWWLFHLILIQILMVALPEEFFYRGYMLTRLDTLWPPREIFGITVSWGNLLTSVLFAITHFIIGYQPYRLAVFFPSLLFGVLRQKTGSLFVPVLFHAVANLFMKLLEMWYL